VRTRSAEQQGKLVWFNRLASDVPRSNFAVPRSEWAAQDSNL